MESINGWSKVELFVDFDIAHCGDVPTFVERYIRFFNEERPSSALGYMTPKAYREAAAKGETVPKKPSKVIREKAKDDRRGEKQKEMIKVSTKR